MQKIHYEYEKANHIQKVSNLNILLLLNTNKVVYPQVKGKVRGPPLEENFRSQKFLSDKNFEISTKKSDFLHIKSCKAHHI